MMKCVECKKVATVAGYSINREVDRKVNEIFEPYGPRSVFYTVNDDDLMLDSFKTFKEAVNYAEAYRAWNG